MAGNALSDAPPRGAASDAISSCNDPADAITIHFRPKGMPVTRLTRNVRKPLIVSAPALCISYKTKPPVKQKRGATVGGVTHGRICAQRADRPAYPAGKY